MARAKVKNTFHSYNRTFERLGIYKKAATKLMKEAQRYGKTAGQLPLGPIRDYLESKGTFKRVKLYRGIIFVFNKNSTSCLTAYPLPEEIKAKQLEFDAQ